ncbi:pyridoxamine 5'-phosphate oxidase family protein [Mycolicibacterium arenosum]|uniref:Pyridoxamine 5'-phosphate oxidase family protein n=1 Tax=Mycolicibacterium arenosum TaxID=2952157 RepID=A0ABT1LVQ2_9MYCO|nr:pyridoxamine 5'-phosphate oxidase family protein [Mycolicibacterium sp. CAU 1645]MCP9270979.1 pyridoxamine 5'-phosphate oxidase family protein [Mycolicibacterium sp. CAU 1645]
MSNPTQPVTVLSATECWELLSSATLGRLVTSVDGHPEIFPINFVVRGRTVLFCTAQGTKLVSAAINDQVLFEVDHHDVDTGWSVIVKGFAQVLRSEEDLADAAQAGLLAWEPPARQHFIRIRPLSVTGRRFAFTARPAEPVAHKSHAAADSQ